jgi:AcrR family transcriptional regulator
MYYRALPRRMPDQRLNDLFECATRVFIAQGYRRTQMSDVAAAMGVAKGTVYLYVESKEALFDAVLRHADAQLPQLSQLALPIPTPDPGSLLRLLETRLEQEVAPPALRQALARRRVRDVRKELESIVRELFASAHRNRIAIKLIDRCGSDHPELASIFYERGRLAQLGLLERYLAARIRNGHFKALPDAAVAARFMIETIMTWAVHIEWDPAPETIDPCDAEETVVHFLLGGLLEEE